MSDTYYVLRIIDVCMYGIILIGFWRARATFFKADKRERMFKVGLGMLIVTGAYSSIEILATGVPGGPRVFIVSVPLLFLVVALHSDLPARLINWWKKRRG